MRLSEAIRLGAMLGGRQVFGAYRNTGAGTCAIGGALKAIGKLQRNYDACTEEARNQWPWATIEGHEYQCPHSNCEFKEVPRCVVAHLNDTHKWSREHIADWVATVEPKEAEQPAVEPVEALAEFVR